MRAALLIGSLSAVAAWGVAAPAAPALLELAPPPERSIDRVAFAIIALQALLLYRIARKAESLDGGRLLRAAALARDQTAKRAVEVKPVAAGLAVQLDRLTDLQRAMLSRARKAFTEAGGELDALWEPFLVRFLVAADWSEQKAMKQLLATARWRVGVSGASAIRRKIADGWRLGDHPAFDRLLGSINVVVDHRTSANGDLLAIAHIGSLDPDVWFSQHTDAEWESICLHLFEFVSYRADALSASSRSLVRQAVVLDYEGLGWQHLNPRIVFRLKPQISLPEAHFPEMIGSVTCINTPPLFLTMWGIVSPWLSERLRKRVTTVDADETRTSLMRLAPKSSLPRAYGGSCASMPKDVRASLGLADVPAWRLNALYGAGKLDGYAYGDGAA